MIISGLLVKIKNHSTPYTVSFNLTSFFIIYCLVFVNIISMSTFMPLTIFVCLKVAFFLVYGVVLRVIANGIARATRICPWLVVLEAGDSEAMTPILKTICLRIWLLEDPGWSGHGFWLLAAWIQRS